VTNDGGKVHLSFAHDPVIFGAESFVYNDKVITAVNLTERNGSVEIVVSGTSPLVATMQDAGKAISVSTAPTLATAAPTAPPPATQVPGNVPPAQPAAEQAVLVQKPVTSANSVPFFVMIDPSHGGDETGARFSGTLFEKDITLAVARKLRTELHNRGVAAILLRDSDATITYDQRAVTANAQRAAIYVTIHAGIPGTGVRVYTAMPGPSAFSQKKKTSGPFVSWEHAQESQLDKSRLLANAMVMEMMAARIVSGSTSAPLLPLNSIAAPAVAVEIAPISVDARPDSMTLPRYQQAIVASLAAAIVNARPKLEARP
jgi:N-acetylmuramoyl-L-alanine amidase